MKRKKKTGALLLALLLVVSFLPMMRSYAADCIVGGDNHTPWNSIQDGMFTYDGGTMTITTSNGALQGQSSEITVPENTTVTVAVAPISGYTVRLRVNGQEVAVNNGVYTTTTTSEQSNLKFEACFENTNSGEGSNPGNPNPPAGNQPICLILEGNAFDGTDTDYYHYMKAQDASFEIYVQLDPNGTSQTLQSLIDDTKVVLAPESQTTYRFDKSISYVGVYVMYASELYTVSAPEEGGTNESGEAVFTLNQGDEQHIQIDSKSETLTVTWAYDSTSFGADAYLEHGTAEVTAIEGVSDLFSQFGGNPGNAQGGNIAVPSGKKVTIRLVPDYGYQVAGLQLNGGVTLQPDDAQTSTFTFVMGNSPVHLKGIFTKASDTVSTNSKQIESAGIANGANAVASGNLRLTVSDAESYDTTAAQALVSGAQSAQAVDLKLDQIVSKGNGTNWENNITEFENPVTLNLALDNYDANYDYIVVRNHNGTLTELATTVEQGTLSFETNQFSTYVIVKKAKTTESITTTEKPTSTSGTEVKNPSTGTPPTGDTALPVACAVMCMVSTILLIGMKKNNHNFRVGKCVCHVRKICFRAWFFVDVN